MQTASVPRVMVCDLDGVVRRFDPDRQVAIEARHGLPAGAITALAFEPQLLLPAITGAVTDESWRTSVAAALSRRYPLIDSAAAVAEWSASPGAADHDVVELLRRVRMRVPVIALTNATTRLPSDLARAGLNAVFDWVVSSADIGHAKPAAQAFQATQDAAIRLLGVASIRPEEILFVDDNGENVTAATAFGWTAVRFTSARQLAMTCRAAGLALG